MYSINNKINMQDGSNTSDYDPMRYTNGNNSNHEPLFTPQGSMICNEYYNNFPDYNAFHPGGLNTGGGADIEHNNIQQNNNTEEQDLYEIQNNNNNNNNSRQHLSLENIDTIVSNAQNAVKSLYYQCEFDEIRNFLNLNFPMVLTYNSLTILVSYK
jgi:hypothetical protein